MTAHQVKKIELPLLIVIHVSQRCFLLHSRIGGHRAVAALSILFARPRGNQSITSHPSTRASVNSSERTDNIPAGGGHSPRCCHIVAVLCYRPCASKEDTPLRYLITLSLPVFALVSPSGGVACLMSTSIEHVSRRPGSFM